MAEDARLPDAAEPPAEEDEEREGRADLRGRGLGQALRRARLGPPFAGGGGAAQRRRAGRPRKAPKRARAQVRGAGGGPDELPSPLQGNMWKVLVKQGDTVEEGQLLCIIEAMKMENEITAHKAGTIVELPIEEGEPIQAGAPIATIIASPPRASLTRPGGVARVDRRCSRGGWPVRQLGLGAALAQRLQVGASSSRIRSAAPVDRRAVTGTTCSAALTSGRRRSSVAR